jgi:fimbrial chaperone protein
MTFLAVFFRVLRLCGFMLMASSAIAASFSVEPTRVFLKDTPQIVLKVGNAGESEVFIQTELMAWAQQDEKDVYTTSRDILVSPPMFKIPAGGEQTVRVRLMRGDASKLERNYRLFLQEVPQAKPTQAMLSTTLKMGVPIFIQPEKLDPANLVWRVTRSADGLRVQVSNTTNSHIQLTGLRLSTSEGKVLSDEKVFVYVLPGQSYHWDVKLKQPLREDKVLLQANSDRDEIKATVSLSATIVAP